MFNNVSSNNIKEILKGLSKEDNLKIIKAVLPDIHVQNYSENSKEIRAGLNGKIKISDGRVKNWSSGQNLFGIVKDAKNLSEKHHVYKAIAEILGITNTYEYKERINKNKPTPAPKINIDIDKHALKVFYNFLNDKFLNDEKTQKEYKKLYYKKRELELSNDFLPLHPGYLKEFIAENYNEYQKLKGLIPYWEYRLIQFHRDFNNEIDYFTGYLFDSHYEKYSNKKYEYKKSKKPSVITSKTYGRNSFKKQIIKENLFFIVESVDKAEALIQLGYSAIGLNGIGSYTALESALNEILDKIKSDNLKAIILLDSKKEIQTNENNSIEKIAGMLENLDISYSIAEIEKPKINSNIKDFDINDKFLNKDNTAREKYIKKLLSKTLSLKEFKKKLGKNKNLDTKNIFRTPIKARLGNKTIVEIDKKTIDEIRNNQLIKLGIIEFLKDENKTYLIIKAGAGAGKTYSLLTMGKKILYLTGNTSLINDMMKDCKERNIKAHYQKSNSNLCKDNHEKNKAPIDETSLYYKFKKLNEKNLDTSKVCGTCQFKKGCMFSDKIKQIGYSDTKDKNLKVVAMTIDKYINADKETRDLITFFNPELIVIDENMSLVNNLVIDKKELLLLEKYIINNTDNENIKKLFNLLKTMIKDLPNDETMQRGKELYNFFNSNYNGFKELYNSIKITEIEDIIEKLELQEFLEIEDLPNINLLPEFLRALKNKCENMVIINGNFQISTKKNFVLRENSKVVHLDATANLNFFSKDLNIPEDKISLLELRGFNPNKEVFQYVDSSGKNSALKQGYSIYENLIYFINSEIFDKNLTGLIVVPLELELIMKQDPNLKEALLTGRLFIEHHYNLRGRNDFKECDFCIVTAPKINYKVIETIGYILYGITDFELVHDTIQSNIYDKNSNSYLKLENSRVYKNPLMNQLVKKFQQDEIYQDVNRIDRTGNQKKQVYIFDQIDMTGLIYEDIESFDFKTERKKNKSKSDSLINYLKDLLLSSKENYPFLLLNDLLEIFIKSDKKNKNYSFDISETLINSSSSMFSYNIYNLITKSLATNINDTYSLPVLIKSLKTAIIETGFKEKTISLCFDGINYIPLKFIYFDNNIFSSCESILKEKFKFIPIEKLPTPAPAIPENIIIDETNNINLIQDNSFEAEEIKETLLIEIAKNFYLTEVNKAINLNRTIDRKFLVWIENNCVLNSSTYRNFTYFNKLKNDFINLSDNDISTVLVMVHNFYTENKERFNNQIIDMNGVNMDNDSNDFKYTSKIIAEGDKRFNDFKYKRIKELKIIDTECLMKINAYLEKKNISDYELLVSEWVYKCLLNEKEAINNQILFKLNNIPSNVIQINRNKSKCEKEYLYKLAEDIYYLVKKSNYDIYIDVENKCWSDYFKHVFNNGDEYNYMIKHISLKFSISSELSQKLFDYYPNQLQEFINLA